MGEAPQKRKWFCVFFLFDTYFSYSSEIRAGGHALVATFGERLVDSALVKGRPHCLSQSFDFRISAGSKPAVEERRRRSGGSPNSMMMFFFFLQKVGTTTRSERARARGGLRKRRCVFVHSSDGAHPPSPSHSRRVEALEIHHANAPSSHKRFVARSFSYAL